MIAFTQAIGIRVVALVLAGAASCCMVYVALYPGQAGRVRRLFRLLFTAVIGVPLGLASLAVGVVPQKGKPALPWCA